MATFDFRTHLLRQKRQRRRRTALFVALGVLTGAFLALAGPKLPAIAQSFTSTTDQPHFETCGTVRRTCVVDGDTIWLRGEKIRIADIDTPEISEPRCEYELRLGDQATDRLVELLNEGPFEVRPIGNRDKDRYGRSLRVLVRDGQSIGDQLVSEGLARTWTGRREPWC